MSIRNFGDLQRAIVQQVRGIIGNMKDMENLTAYGGKNALANSDHVTVSDAKKDGTPMFIDGISRWGNPIEVIGMNMDRRK
jgi:hypothetical protein